MGILDIFTNSNETNIPEKQKELFKLLYIMEAYSVIGNDSVSLEKIGNIEKRYVENLGYNLEDFVNIINSIHNELGNHWNIYGEGKMIKDVINENINLNFQNYTKEEQIDILRSLIMIMFVDIGFNYGKYNTAHTYIIQTIGKKLGIDDLAFKVEAFLDANYHRNLPEMTIFMHTGLFLSKIL